MEVFGIFGIVAFVWCCSLESKVKKLERIIKANALNGVNPEKGSLRAILEKQIGKTVKLTFNDGVTVFEFEFNKPCLIKDIDDEWILIGVNSGKKSEAEMLVKIESIKNLSV